MEGKCVLVSKYYIEELAELGEVLNFSSCDADDVIKVYKLSNESYRKMVKKRILSREELENIVPPLRIEEADFVTISGRVEAKANEYWTAVKGKNKKYKAKLFEKLLSELLNSKVQYI